MVGLAEELGLVRGHGVDQMDGFLGAGRPCSNRCRSIGQVGSAGRRTRRRSRPSTMVFLAGGILMPL